MRFAHGIVVALSILAIIAVFAAEGVDAIDPSVELVEETVIVGELVEESNYSWLAYLAIVTPTGVTSANGVVVSRDIYLDAGFDDLCSSRATILTVAHFCQNFDGNPILIFEPDGAEHICLPYAMSVKDDLCLVAVLDEWGGEINDTLIDPNFVPLQTELYSFANPLGRFHGIGTLPSQVGMRYEHFVTFRFDGYYSGIYNDVTFAHSIETTPGQSGSPILFGGAIFGITSSQDTRTNGIGFAVRGDVIRAFLLEHNVPIDYVTESPQQPVPENEPLRAD